MLQFKFMAIVKLLSNKYYKTVFLLVNIDLGEVKETNWYPS